jgi:hypothetical protein
MELPPRDRDEFKPSPKKSTWQNLAAWCDNKIQRAAADDSGTHVVYEMLWYASLLLGVVASSILFLVVVTALPITGGEGYVKKGVDELLKRAPTSGKSGIAAPLLAAVIGGGTLVGTVAATQAGGQGRGVYERASIESAARSSLIRAGDQVSYRGGDIDAAFHSTEEVELPPPAINLDPITDSLYTISESAGRVVGETRRANEKIAEVLRSALSRIAGQERAASETSRLLVALQQAVGIVQTDLGRHEDDATQLEQALAKLTSAVAEHEAEIAGAVQTVKEIEDRQADASARYLAQTAQRDPRGLFARTFSGTLYQVGPLVPSLMSTFLEDTTDPKARTAMLEVLHKMRGEGPFKGSEFESRLRKELHKRLAPEQVKILLRQSNRSALLKICAMPRR